MPAYAIEHVERGPYVQETRILWHQPPGDAREIETQIEAVLDSGEDVGSLKDRIEELEKEVTDWETGNTDEMEELRIAAKRAEERAEHYAREVDRWCDAASASLSPVSKVHDLMARVAALETELEKAREEVRNARHVAGKASALEACEAYLRRCRGEHKKAYGFALLSWLKDGKKGPQPMATVTTQEEIRRKFYSLGMVL